MLSTSCTSARGVTFGIMESGGQSLWQRLEAPAQVITAVIAVAALVSKAVPRMRHFFEGHGIPLDVIWPLSLAAFVLLLLYWRFIGANPVLELSPMWVVPKQGETEDDVDTGPLREALKRVRGELRSNGVTLATAIRERRYPHDPPLGVEEWHAHSQMLARDLENPSVYVAAHDAYHHCERINNVVEQRHSVAAASFAFGDAWQLVQPIDALEEVQALIRTAIEVVGSAIAEIGVQR
jgi:hypothetical protein